MNRSSLNEKWIKASIIGTIWAASEIVFGSFLHNLKVPFSGNALTAIGLIILISVSYVWKERGLYWRAGLICALLKTMSPSAVIFGPMLAIFSQALLLELSVRIFGKTLSGFVIGSMLAMSWNLFQKIANFILFYGFNVIELYASLIKFAQKHLHWQGDIAWLPILLLLILYCLLGIFAAVIGIRVGRKVQSQNSDSEMGKNTAKEIEMLHASATFNYSLVWLFANVVLILGSFLLLNLSSWFYWGPLITIIIVIWSFRYKRALKQISKPKFWIFFVGITMLTAFLFSGFQSGGHSLAFGFMTGIQMNFRAILIIAGFSVLGTELYNPRIRAFFLKTSFRQLPIALELSFESLPSMIANMPDFKSMIKNPVEHIARLVSQAICSLDGIKKKLSRRIFIITGSVGQGKTSTLRKVIEELSANSITVGGIYSLRIMDGTDVNGYDVVHVISQERAVFLRRSEDNGFMKIGRFSVYPEGLAFGMRALLPTTNENCELVVIDEIGKLELDNQGWAEGFEALLRTARCHLILVVRENLKKEIMQKWNIREYDEYNVGEFSPSEISGYILKLLQ